LWKLKKKKLENPGAWPDEALFWVQPLTPGRRTVCATGVWVGRGNRRRRRLTQLAAEAATDQQGVNQIRPRIIIRSDVMSILASLLSCHFHFSQSPHVASSSEAASGRAIVFSDNYRLYSILVSLFSVL